MNGSISKKCPCILWFKMYCGKFICSYVKCSYIDLYIKCCAQVLQNVSEHWLSTYSPILFFMIWSIFEHIFCKLHHSHHSNTISYIPKYLILVLYEFYIHLIRVLQCLCLIYSNIYEGITNFSQICIKSKNH